MVSRRNEIYLIFTLLSASGLSAFQTRQSISCLHPTTYTTSYGGGLLKSSSVCFAATIKSREIEHQVTKPKNDNKQKGITKWLPHRLTSIRMIQNENENDEFGYYKGKSIDEKSIRRMPVGEAQPNSNNKLKLFRRGRNGSVSEASTRSRTPSGSKVSIVNFWRRSRRRETSVAETRMRAVDVSSSISEHSSITSQVHRKSNANLLVGLQIVGFLGSSLFGAIGSTFQNHVNKRLVPSSILLYKPSKDYYNALQFIDVFKTVVDNFFESAVLTTQKRLTDFLIPVIKTTPSISSSDFRGLLSLPSRRPTSLASLPRKKRNQSNSQSTPGSKLIESLVESRITKHSNSTSLQINVVPEKNVIFNFLTKKAAAANELAIKFDSIIFPNIRMSGGGQLTFHNIAYHVGKANRFYNPFGITADVVLTADDIMHSSCVRNGLENLLNRVLRNSGLRKVQKSKSVVVQSVTILSSKKISCTGLATTILGDKIPFEVRTGLDMTGQGHVLTLPGMEIALYPETIGLFFPVVPDMHVDMGNNANLQRIAFTGGNQSNKIEKFILDNMKTEKKINERPLQIEISAGVRVTPRQEKPASYRQRESFAHCKCDVGKWVTRIGRFNS